MDFSKILYPLRGKVVLEALEEPESISGIIIPLDFRERYPQIARVRLVGKGSSLNPGAIVVLPNEGADVAFGSYFYFKVAFAILHDSGAETKIQCDEEVWPILREAVEEDRRSGNRRLIRVKTLDGETIGFTSDEVLDYGLEDFSHPGYKLDYIPVHMFWAFEGSMKKLFYITEESQILLTIEE